MKSAKQFRRLRAEKIEQPRAIAIGITGICNFGCSFCITRGIHEKVDMPVEDFKLLIDRLAAAKVKCPVCIAGGEPFLHPHAAEMVRYAVKKLGTKVQVTSNLSKVPTTAAGAEKFLKSLGGAKLNISVDREHLRFDKDLPKRIQATIAVAEKTNSRISIISVARNTYEKSHPFPKEIAGIIPKQLRQNAGVRLEFFARANPERKEQLEYWRRTSRGEMLFPPMHVMEIFDVYGEPLKGTPGVNIEFLPNHKAIISPGVFRPLYFPQVSIGNWKREPMTDILGKNRQMKQEMIGEWLGFWSKRTQERAQKLEKGLVKLMIRKKALFAKSRLRDFKREQALRQHLRKK